MVFGVAEIFAAAMNWLAIGFEIWVQWGILATVQDFYLVSPRRGGSNSSSSKPDECVTRFDTFKS